MISQLMVRVQDDTLEALQARADAQRRDLTLAVEALIRDGLKVLPVAGRAIVISGETLEQLERVLAGGSILHGADLLSKVQRLAGISFFHLRLPFTPGQLEALEEKAKRQGLTVDQLVERTAPRVYEQFFDLVQRV